MRAPRLTMAALATVFSCNSSSSAPAAAEVVLDPGYVFLPGIGQTRVVTAQMKDAKGEPIHAEVTWTSTAPDKVAVDASGKLTAKAIGTAQVVAKSGNVVSAPLIVLVAEPVAGALLVTDAQVESVGAFDSASGVAEAGSRYPVQLRGLAAPAPGTIVLAAETAPVAGRVVSAVPQGDGIQVTLEVLPMRELVRNASMDLTLDLSGYEWTIDTSAPPPLARAERSRALFGGGLDLKPFSKATCTGSMSEALYNFTPGVTPSGHATWVSSGNVVDGNDNGEVRVEIQGDYTLTGVTKIEVQAGLKGSATCRVQNKVDIPIFGWASIIIEPAIVYGLGLDVSAEVDVISGELDIDWNAHIVFDVGFVCPSGGDCALIDDVTHEVNAKPTLRLPSSHDMKADLTGHLYGLVALDALAGRGEAAAAELLIFKVGPQQHATLASEDSQAFREDYASSYDLKIKGGLTAGAELKTLLKKLPAGGSTAGSFTAVPIDVPVAKSPSGNFGVDKHVVAIGKKVTLDIALDPATMNYGPFGANVASIEIWRLKEGDVEYKPLRSITANASGQSHFQYQWEPTTDDIGNNTLVALVATNVLPLLDVEANPNTQQQVQVSCFTPAGARLRSGAATCEDSWIGTSNSMIGLTAIDALVTWKEDTVQTIPGSNQVVYYPVGTVSVTGYTDASGCDITYSPSSYTLTGGGTDPHQNGGSLTIDHGQTPPAYFGTGVTQWITTITRTCPDGSSSSGQFPTGGAWFYAQGNLAPDELSFSGTQTPGGAGQTYTFNFKRP